MEPLAYTHLALSYEESGGDLSAKRRAVVPASQRRSLVDVFFHQLMVWLTRRRLPASSTATTSNSSIPAHPPGSSGWSAVRVSSRPEGITIDLEPEYNSQQYRQEKWQ